MTSKDNSSKFLDGLMIVKAHANDRFSINVCESSAICISGLSTFTDDEIDNLKNLHWNAANENNLGYASFYELEYVDY